ncbi:MAG: hypothetical protein FJ149_01225 [Euryarchaeota archaeon]|nr:hypothetical protein [Euryarchaeota archaeon]
MAVMLRRRRRGLSALFDAVLFFTIILAATGALFWWASAARAGATADIATRDLGRAAADIQSAALECTVGPVDYSLGGRSLLFTGTVCECLALIVRCRSAGPDSGTAGLEGAVRRIYALLVEEPLRFEVRASAEGLVQDIVISDEGAGPGGPGEVRWTCSVPLVVNGLEGELALHLWR